MKENVLSDQEKTHLRHLAFYLHENRKWTRVLGRRICFTIPFIALTLLAAYKEKPFALIANGCASVIGIKCIQNANFYRRRSAYRVRQQQKSFELN